jgi:hypothetical protein
MRVPPVRFKVWYIMVAVVVIALSFGYLRRPYPVTTTLEMAVIETKNSITYMDITWRLSDGRVQRITAQCPKGGTIPRDLEASETWPKDRSHLGPFLRIEWSDGSTSYYLEGR